MNNITVIYSDCILFLCYMILVFCDFVDKKIVQCIFLSKKHHDSICAVDAGGDRYPVESEVKRFHSLHVIRVYGVNQR